MATIKDNQAPFEYDDDKAVKFIKNYISEDLSKKISEDEIYYFIDLITEYYEQQGFLEDFDEEEEDIDISIDLGKIVEYIIKNAKRDDVGSFSEEEVLEVVEAEMQYCGFEEVVE